MFDIDIRRRGGVLVSPLLVSTVEQPTRSTIPFLFGRVGPISSVILAIYIIIISF